MIKISAFAQQNANIDDILCLPFDKRQKSRQRVQLASGAEAGLLLPRGTILRGGDCLLSEGGQVIQVEAEAEQVSTVMSGDPLLLLRAAYHLGNRHVPLQINHDALRYLHDHVLDEMILQLGLDVEQELAPFEPEQGAYHGQGHSHHY